METSDLVELTMAKHHRIEDYGDRPLELLEQARPRG